MNYGFSWTTLNYREDLEGIYIPDRNRCHGASKGDEKFHEGADDGVAEVAHL